MLNELPIVERIGQIAAVRSRDCNQCIRTPDSSPPLKSIREPVDRTAARQRERRWPVITLGIY
jgi:hypothetical protein